MKYIVIDAELNGTGIRNKYESGFLDPRDLRLNPNTINKLNQWLLDYENEHYKGYKIEHIIDELDKEGKEIALIIKSELLDVKMEYFSNARMTYEIL